jgi:hypothetical protein
MLLGGSFVHHVGVGVEDAGVVVSDVLVMMSMKVMVLVPVWMMTMVK